MSELWYAPDKINRFTCEELAWVFREVWGQGWPPQETGYFDAHLDVDNGGVSGDLLKAAEVVMWEIESRMKAAKCPAICEVLLFETQTEYFKKADLWHYDRFKDHLSPPARGLLGYLSGYRRRHRTLAEWLSDKERKRKMGKNSPILQPLA